MPDDNLMDQSEIEQLLNQSRNEASADDPAPAPSAAAEESDGPMGQSDVESLLKENAAATPAATGQEAAPATEDDSKLLAQDDIEKLLEDSQAASSASAPETSETPTAKADAGSPHSDGGMAQGDIDFLLNQAEKALASIDGETSGDLPPGVSSFRLEEFSGAAPSTETATLDLIRDVELDLKIELGRTHMYLEDVLKLRKGSVVPLDKLAGDPVDIYVNGRLIARGEVLVLNDNFCVRVAELITGVSVSA